MTSHSNDTELADRGDDTTGQDTILPGAYPMVQPIRAALYLESVKSFGDWRILISSRAEKMLRKERKSDRESFEIVIKKIRELSNGHFSRDNQKQLNGSSMGIPIFEAKTTTRDLRLVYQIDCVPEYYDSDLEIQVVKIYGMYTHAQLDLRFWKSVGHQLARKGKEYTRRCTFRNVSRHRGRDVILPALFPAPKEIPPEVGYNFLQLPAQDLDDIHSLLYSEKYVALSRALLYSMLANQDVQHVFSMSRKEMEIIEHPHSCYVLGRSGTGKTTTMLMKMLGIENTWKHTTHPEGNHKLRQLFVTQSRMLAGKVEEYFSKLMESLSTATKSPQELMEIARAQGAAQEHRELFNIDDTLNWRSDLPSRFSLLKDEHFPLFLTFDHLCKLLEADLAEDPEVDAMIVHKPKKFISSSVFCQSYWPHFPQTLTKGLNSSMVFSEFMGVIKGSEESLAYEEGFLDRKSYENLSHRTQPAFAHQRAVVYHIFQSYLRLKQRRAEHDAADRTRALIKLVEESGIPGRPIDYLYVDEAQDNLLIDAIVLRALCINPNGLFWAGDTAQTIAAGSSFRFDDLKAFLFRIEHERQEKLVGVRAIQPTIEDPRMFQLAINYRSHAGIVNCAHSVIELITKFWPYSIDILAQEQGEVDGLKPLFLNTSGQDPVISKQFLLGTNEHIELGAQQCIIVRNDVARVKLQKQLGDIGTIMTPYESKGLEFNDVLIYNFFQDSTMNLSQWRVVLNALGPAHGPSFNETHHAGVCSELKILYVSLTRARKRVWIMDSSEASQPMQEFWNARNLIMTYSSSTDGPLAVSSSHDEWEEAGRTLFMNKRYAHAVRCFQKARLTREEDIAKAYLLREQAHTAASSDQPEGISFTDAAKAFMKCTSQTTAERHVYLRIAAECYQECSKVSEAAELYIEVEEFDRAALLYLSKEMWVRAMQVVRENKDRMQETVISRIIHQCRMHYLANQELSQARKLFSSDDEALAFMKEHDFNEARVHFLVKINRKAEAANVLLEMGREPEGYRLMVQDYENVSSMRRVSDYILDKLWQYLSLGFVPKRNQTLQAVADLLHLATLLNQALLDPKDCDEISMFEAIMSMELSQLQQLGQKFFERANIVATILCFDHVFHASRSTEITTRHLPIILEYARLLSLDPSEDPSVQKLLGIHPMPRGKLFLVPSQTTLYSALKDLPKSFNDEVQVTGRELLLEARTLLRSRLRRSLSLVMTIKVLKAWPLATSLQFVRQVVYDKLPVDTKVLCDILEYFCGSFVVSMNIQGKGVLDDVVLPRSWLLVLLKNIDECRSRDTRLFRLIVDPLAELSTQIRLTDPDCTAVLYRICRCLCLLGYNVPMSALRLEILRVISSLPEDFVQLASLTSYKKARTWNQLAKAVCSYNAEFPADNLVQLSPGNEASVPRPPASGITRVIYKDILTIPSLLTNPPRWERPLKSRPVTLGPVRKAEVPASKGENKERDALASGGDDAVIKDVLEGHVETAEFSETGTHDGTELHDKALPPNFISSEAQKHAANAILYAYRRLVSRRRGVGLGQLPVGLDRIFTSCLEEARCIHWPSGHIYRKLYLGALPTILLCLKKVLEVIAAAKSEVKERSKVAEHLELEELRNQQTELVHASKSMNHLLHTLDPKLKVHQQHDVSLLQTAALEVQTHFLQFPPKNAEALEDNLALALNAIVRASGCSTAAQ